VASGLAALIAFVFIRINKQHKSFTHLNMRAFDQEKGTTPGRAVS
jgi:hypothetical protein